MRRAAFLAGVVLALVPSQECVGPSAPAAGVAGARTVSVAEAPVSRPSRAGEAPAERVVRGALAVRGTSFVYPDGRPFRWRGISGFRLLEQVAHGREGEARAFMRWARARGFNLVRVLGMARHLFGLTPQDGLRALPRLLRLAEEEDLYLELVLFADTRDFPGLSFPGHVQAVSSAVAGAANVVVELANENDHPTQDARLKDLALLQALRARLPRALPVSLGSLHGAADLTNRYPGGDYLTAHVYRGGDGWEQVGRLTTLARLEANAARPVVSDEPIGAAERVDPGRRLDDPAVFYAFGALGRMAGLDGTFHCEDCLQARVPGPVQRQCADAFLEGTRVLPDAEDARLVPAARAGGPLSVERVPGAAGVYVAQVARGDTRLVLALGLRPGAAIPWRPRWSATVVAERPGVHLYRARQP